MIDISKLRPPCDMHDLAKKINQFIDHMEEKQRTDFVIPLYNEDVDKLTRFAKRTIGKSLQEVHWRGYKLTKSGVSK